MATTDCCSSKTIDSASMCSSCPDLGCLVEVLGGGPDMMVGMSVRKVAVQSRTRSPCHDGPSKCVTASTVYCDSSNGVGVADCSAEVTIDGGILESREVVS